MTVAFDQECAISDGGLLLLIDCVARGRRIFPGDQWRSGKEKQPQWPGDILRMPSALEAGTNYTRIARYGPNRGHVGKEESK